MNWILFSERLPQLGMEIDVLAGGVSRMNLGRLRRIEDLGGGWIGFDADNAIGAAVRPHYKWRESVTPVAVEKQVEGL